MSNEIGIIIGAGKPSIEMVAEHKDKMIIVGQQDQFEPEPIRYHNLHVPAIAVIDTVAMDGKAKRRARRAAERKNKNDNNHKQIWRTANQLAEPQAPGMGSGSTCVACKNENRIFIGIEKEEQYFKIAERRLNDIR